MADGKAQAGQHNYDWYRAYEAISERYQGGTRPFAEAVRVTVLPDDAGGVRGVIGYPASPELWDEVGGCIWMAGDDPDNLQWVSGDELRSWLARVNRGDPQ